MALSSTRLRWRIGEHSLARCANAQTHNDGGCPTKMTMKIRIKTLALVGSAAIAFCGCASVTNRTDWLTSAQYQHAFDKSVRDGFYPDKVEGRCENDSEQFRAEWKGIPLGAGFVSHHAMTKESYETRNQEYVSTGYILESVGKFKDCSGTERYQATWLKRK